MDSKDGMVLGVAVSSVTAAGHPELIPFVVAAFAIFEVIKKAVEQGNKKPQIHTVVRLYVGLDGSMNGPDLTAGNQPSIQLWDALGQRWGRTKNGGMLKSGNFVDIEVKADKHRGNSRPAYVAIDSSKWNGVCISAVSFKFPDGGSSHWTGDIGYTCKELGFKWFHSATTVNNNGYAPKCIWVDGDNTEIIPNDKSSRIPQGFSFHIPSFEPTEARVQQYNLIQGSMCKARARIATRFRTSWNDPVRMFMPVLQFNQSGADYDMERVLADHPSDGWTQDWQKPHQHPDDVRKRMEQAKIFGLGPIPKGWHNRRDEAEEADEEVGNDDEIVETEDDMGREELEDMTDDAGDEADAEAEDQVDDVEIAEPAQVKTLKNFDGIIVHSNHKAHSAIEVCEHEHSWGPDFVSLQEQIYCDMTSRHTWPLCTEKTAWNCFDHKVGQLRGKENAFDPMKGFLNAAAASIQFAPQSMPVKHYHRTINWF